MKDEIQQIVDYNTPVSNYLRLIKALGDLQSVIIDTRFGRVPTHAIAKKMGTLLLRMKLFARSYKVDEGEINKCREVELKDLLDYIAKEYSKGDI